MTKKNLLPVEPDTAVALLPDKKVLRWILWQDITPIHSRVIALECTTSLVRKL